MKNLKEGGIKLDLITNNTKALINKKDSSRDTNGNNNSTGLKKNIKSQRIIKGIYAFNSKLIKNHLFNMGKIDKSNNHSKRESKDKIKKKENNKEIKNDLSVKDKIISNNNNDIKNMIRDEKRNSCDNIYNKNNNEYKNLFEKYRINDSSINDNKKNESYKIKDINQQEKFKSTIEKIPNVLPENNNKEDEDKQFQSDFDDLLS